MTSAPRRRASARSASVPGACRIPSWAKAQSWRSSAGAYSALSGRSASSPRSPTIGSTSTWLRIAVVPWRTAMSRTARARVRMSSTVNRRLASPVMRMASWSVPSTLGVRSLNRALSRWMCDSTRPGVTARPSQRSIRSAGRPEGFPMAAIRPLATAEVAERSVGKPAFLQDQIQGLRHRSALHPQLASNACSKHASGARATPAPT